MWILVVLMPEPVGRKHVQLHITNQGMWTNLQFRIEKIGTLVCVELTQVNYPDLFAFGSSEFVCIVMLKLPDVLQPAFIHPSFVMKTNIDLMRSCPIVVLAELLQFFHHAANG